MKHINPKTRAYDVIQTIKMDRSCEKEAGTSEELFRGGIHRVANRLGLITTQSEKKTTEALSSLLPQDDLHLLKLRLKDLAVSVCHSSKPDCIHCVLSQICPRVGVE